MFMFRIFYYFLVYLLVCLLLIKINPGNKLVITWFLEQYGIYFSRFFFITLALRVRAINQKLEK